MSAPRVRDRSEEPPAPSRALAGPGWRLLRWGLAMALFAWLGAQHWPETVDDTVISVDYARQWATGHGLTWTTGERVEGYSNFLLVALLAAGIRLGADAALLAQWISATSVAAILALLSRWLPRGLTGTAALLALAAWGPLDYWGQIGLEGPLFGLLLGLGWALLGRGAWGGAAGLLALASVTRPEGPLYLGLALLFRLRGPRTWRSGDALAVLSVGFVLLYHAVRLRWFGAFWPTPYLVKVLSVPWTRYGLAQVVGDLWLALPVLGAFALSTKLSRSRTLLALVPLVAQSVLLWRASGDWMTHGRLILPGLIATTLAWASLGEARAPVVWRPVLALALVLIGARWMPTGYGEIRWEKRAILTQGEVISRLSRGLDTPLSEDVFWAARNVPAGDRVMAVDAGMLGAVPEMALIDSRGLNHRGFAMAAATRQEERFMRALVADPATRPEWMRIALWDGAPLPDLPDWLTSLYHLRAEVRYGPARIGWYATHDRSADAALARRRLDAMWAGFPSQPTLAWHAALARAEVGELEAAQQVAAAGRQRWPGDPRFKEAPDSLSFPTGPFGLDYVAGRGTGLYWNTSVLSRPIRANERDQIRLRLDADAPGEEGALARVRWSGPCGAQEKEVAVREAIELPPPACDRDGELRVDIAFVNDQFGEAGDRNLYARLTVADTQ